MLFLVSDDKLTSCVLGAHPAFRRAFHSAVYCQASMSVIFLGGYTDDVRHPLHEIHKISLHPQDLTFTYTKQDYVNLGIFYPLSCQTVWLRGTDELFICGGYTNDEHLKTEVKQSIVQLNMNLGTVVNHDMGRDYSTADSSFVGITPNLAISVGGTSQSMCLLSKVIVPVDECQSKECVINSTDVNPVLWVFCDACRKWLHIL